MVFLQIKIKHIKNLKISKACVIICSVNNICNIDSNYLLR